jgi:hypothetical protein
VHLIVSPRLLLARRDELSGLASQMIRESPFGATFISTIYFRRGLSHAACILNGPTRLDNFGESGKNFIGIGKRPKVPETMLRLVVRWRQMEFAAKEKQCRSANLEKATWKFRLSA